LKRCSTKLVSICPAMKLMLLSKLMWKGMLRFKPIMRYSHRARRIRRIATSRVSHHDMNL